MRLSRLLLMSIVLLFNVYLLSCSTIESGACEITLEEVVELSILGKKPITADYVKKSICYVNSMEDTCKVYKEQIISIGGSVKRTGLNLKKIVKFTDASSRFTANNSCPVDNRVGSCTINLVKFYLYKESGYGSDIDDKIKDLISDSCKNKLGGSWQEK